MENKSGKSTEIKSIGKQAMIKKLFSDTAYSNSKQLVFSPSSRSKVMTNSVIILQGVDFNLTYTPLKHLGYKSVILALGELFANCYTPKGLIINLGVSSKFSYEQIDQIWCGIAAAAKEYNIQEVGLDIIASLTGLSISITSYGEQTAKFYSNTKKPDNNCVLCITGNLGASYMGLHVLERENTAFEAMPSGDSATYKQPDLNKYKYLLSQYLSPHIEPELIKQLIEADIYPSAGKFIANGLAGAVMELCTTYNLGAKIYLEKIPIASETFAMADELNIDATTAALNGGDDYKFLFAVPHEKIEVLHKEFPSFDVIGYLTSPESGCTLITPDGAALALKAQGWS